MAMHIPETTGSWTFEDLRALDADGWRYEIVDGSLVMSPSPGYDHEQVSALLRHALHESVGGQRMVVGPMAVDLHPSYRLPDLVVADRRPLGSDVQKLAAGEVHLAVEVVSPSSRTTDRVTKPAQYAAAGIRAFWRVEIEDAVSVTAYALAEGAATYTELGTWREGEALEVAEPFAVRIAIDDLVP